MTDELAKGSSRHAPDPRQSGSTVSTATSKLYLVWCTWHLSTGHLEVQEFCRNHWQCHWKPAAVSPVLALVLINKSKNYIGCVYKFTIFCPSPLIPVYSTHRFPITWEMVSYLWLLWDPPPSHDHSGEGRGAAMSSVNVGPASPLATNILSQRQLLATGYGKVMPTWNGKSSKNNLETLSVHVIA